MLGRPAGPAREVNTPRPPERREVHQPDQSFALRPYWTPTPRTQRTNRPSVRTSTSSTPSRHSPTPSTSTPPITSHMRAGIIFHRGPPNSGVISSIRLWKTPPRCGKVRQRPVLGLAVLHPASSVPLGISVQEFSNVMAALGGLYREVSKNLGVADIKGLHVSRHREGSLVLECEPLLPQEGYSPFEVNSVSRALLDGLAALKTGNRPNNFTNAALKHASKLTGGFTTEDSTVVVSSAGRSVSCSTAFRSSIQQISNHKTVSWGSVEGNLEMISIRGKLRFNLYELLSDEKIACMFGTGLLDVARKSFGHRVVVYGEIHKRGKAIEHVNVEKVRRRPSSDDLPGFADIRGIADS